MQPLIQYYYNYFIDEKNDGYRLLISSVCLKICCGLYEKFVMDSIKPIEMLDEETKQKYWDKAKEYYAGETKRIEAMKTIYVLHSITGK